MISQPNSVGTDAPQTLSSLLRQHSPTFSPDIVIYTDESKLPTVTGLEELGIPLFGYFIDSHIHYGWHREFAGIFDHVFVAQKDCCESFSEYTGNCSWLPLFANTEPASNEDLVHDVSFVGTLDKTLNPDRVQFIESLGKLVLLNVHSGEFSRVFKQSKIILNQSVKTDINFRVFEALASGRLLLTDNVDNGMNLLLEDGKHFVSYRKNDPEDAARKIRYYLEHEDERQSIASAGHKILLKKHTTNVRKCQIMDQIDRFLITWGSKNPQRSQSGRFYAAARTYLSVARLVSDLSRECNIDIHGKSFYAQKAEMCLQQAKDHIKIEAITRDLAWISIYQEKTDVAKTSIQAAMRMGSDDFETFLCAAYLGNDISETRKHLGFALQRLQVYQKADPLYFEYFYDQVLLCAERIGILGVSE